MQQIKAMSIRVKYCIDVSIYKYETKVRNNIRSIKYNDELLTDPSSIANALNSHYQKTVFEHDSGSLPYFPDRTRVRSVFNMDCIPEINILNRLSKLDPNKAIGSDLLSTYVLKQSKLGLLALLAAPFRQIFMFYDKSISSGQVPSMWKEANVTCIFKKGSRLDPGNYRPVSLTSISSTIMTGFVKDHIMDNSAWFCKW